MRTEKSKASGTRADRRTQADRRPMRRRGSAANIAPISLPSPLRYKALRAPAARTVAGTSSSQSTTTALWHGDQRAVEIGETAELREGFGKFSLVRPSGTTAALILRRANQGLYIVASRNWTRTQMKGQAQAAASIPSAVDVEGRLGLRLRLEPASLRTDRPRLAGRRHRGARRRRGLSVGRRFAHRPHPLQQANDLVAG
jgi:hypothetical protein